MDNISNSLSLPVVMIALIICLLIFHPLYNLYLHPLRHYPGPRLHAAFHFSYALTYLSGRSNAVMHNLHERYGPILRVAPNILSYTDSDAYRDIRGHRKQGTGQNPTDQTGFSAKSMQEQEPVIRQHVDLFISKLKDIATSQHEDNLGTLDIVSWFNFVIFDLIGALSFGESLGCLEHSRLHPWVQAVFDATNMYGKRMMVKWYSPSSILTAWIGWIIGLSAPHSKQQDFAARKVEKRLAMEDPASRMDFVDAMYRAEFEGEDGLKKVLREEIVFNMRLIMLAGSESTATALTGTVFLLATHGDVQRRLAGDVRGLFEREGEIDIWSAQRVKYLGAVLSEAMRVLPPASLSMPRFCQEGGDVICGRWVPAGVTLEIWPMAVTHSSRNFAKPDEFIPERWMDDGERDPIFENDKAEALKPFSYGPRDCIGKSLANVEMRLILARMLWNFDISLADEKGKTWAKDMLGWNLWLKYPLNVVLTPVRRGKK
ncbi:unnamed protein product [Sordaria macrospora k-hell]|uniref:WGS project CABT00000000 data, contig 2.16 n=1 Tax=Sordaria macrospora (strain ATCC MYA-333 / DSM 997 / K(L3346) / K-hell) TaxID=771870 RepID=F7W087_SORMK|nr:uncharacterized protein SMAC_03892 [Sordaria macrospora k-hell]CCC11186.1 unnamed protein product [Sordaria macrospora k-hell]